MSAESEITTIEETAAGWMVERDRGLTSARERELAAWLRADARHAAAFAALEATWELMGEGRVEGLKDLERMERAEGAVFASKEARPAIASISDDRAAMPVRRSRRRKLVWFPVALAAAAAIAIAYVGWWRPQMERRARADAPFSLTASTEVGVLRKVELPDGSVIQLNTDSAVSVSYAAAERRVQLTRGEAHFTVAKNRGRPFIVSAAGVDVRVVGTVFNVRLRSESVDVLVTEGKVRVDSPKDEATGSLTAGQKVSIALGSTALATVVAPVDVAATEIKQTLAWRANRLDFDATPLSEIVTEINRYNHHQLVIADERLKTQRFGGSFPARDYDTIVRMLETNFGVVAERKDDVTLLRLKGK